MVSRLTLTYFILLFAGSIFVTSSKFVDTEIAPKIYITVLGLMIFVLFIVFTKNRKILTPLDKTKLLNYIFVITVIQSIYGILQYFSLFKSNHFSFPITGSFENPTGFAAVLSIGFPLGVFLLLTSTGKIRKFYSFGLIIICLALFLSGSRSGILAVIVSSFGLVKSHIAWIKSKVNNKNRIFLFIVLSLVFLLVVLYYTKQNSASSRLYIWKITSEIIKDKPILGHGYNSFRVAYMDYQAKFFISHPDSEYGHFADNIKHPFNEYLRFTVEFGLIGLIGLFIIAILWYKKVRKSEHPIKHLSISGVTAFLTFSFFSYPLQYPPIWLLLALYLLFPFSIKAIYNNRLLWITRPILLALCVCSIIFFSQKMIAELKWKEISEKSLDGNTVQMLPKYERLKPTLNHNPYFLYNYGAELNVAGNYNKSIEILLECERKFNDYDLQMLLADNYYNINRVDTAIQKYIYAANMIPCRFSPLYQLFEIYRETKQTEKARELALYIVNKKVKIPSNTIRRIKSITNEYIESQ